MQKLDSERIFDSRTRNAMKFAILVHVGLALVIMNSGGDFRYQVQRSHQAQPIEITALDVGPSANIDARSVKSQRNPKKTLRAKKKARRSSTFAKRRSRKARSNGLATRLPSKRYRKSSARIKIDFEKEDHLTEAGDSFTNRELARLRQQEEAYRRYQQRLRELE